jgi:hypothetical protein
MVKGIDRTTKTINVNNNALPYSEVLLPLKFIHLKSIIEKSDLMHIDIDSRETDFCRKIGRPTENWQFDEIHAFNSLSIQTLFFIIEEKLHEPHCCDSTAHGRVPSFEGRFASQFKCGVTASIVGDSWRPSTCGTIGKVFGYGGVAVEPIQDSFL